VLLVAKKRSRIRGRSELVAVIAFHMHRTGPQESALNKRSQASRDMPELIVMPGGQLEAHFFRQRNQSSGLAFVQCEWLLYVDVASRLQASFGNLEMTCGWRRDVNNVRLGHAQQFVQLTKTPANRESLRQLARHQRLPVAHPDDFATAYPLDLRRVVVCDLSASYKRDSKHALLRPAGLEIAVHPSAVGTFGIQPTHVFSF